MENLQRIFKEEKISPEDEKKFIEGLAKISIVIIRTIQESGGIMVPAAQGLTAEMAQLAVGMAGLILKNPESIKKHFPNEAELYCREAPKIIQKLGDLFLTLENEEK